MCQHRAEPNGAFLGKTTNDVLTSIPVVTRVINYVNENYSTASSKEAYLLSKIEELQRALRPIFSELNISSTENLEAKLENAKSERERLELYKEVMEELCRFLGSTEQPHADTASAVDPQLSFPASPIAVSISSEVNETDPRIKALYEELYVLMDILSAISFNKLHKLEDKYWTELETLLEPEREEPPQQNKDSLNSPVSVIV